MVWMLPLETLPGWPEAPPFSLSHLLLLILVLPAAAAVVISVLTFVPTWTGRNREAGVTDNQVALREEAATPDVSA